MVSLDNLTPCTPYAASQMKDGSLYRPCCMRAVPHPNVFLKVKMDNSTSSVILLALGSLNLSLKDSQPSVYSLS